MTLAVLVAAVDVLDRHVDALTSAQLLARPLAALVDAQRQAAGARLLSLELPGWFAGILAQAFVLFYYWRSGGAARWREALTRRLHSAGAVRFAFGATLALLARAAAVIPSFYLWRVDRVMGLSHALTRVWAYEYVLGTAIGMIVAGIIVAVVLWVVQRTHQWYLYAIAAIVAVSLAGAILNPFVVAPLFERYAPVRGALGARARAFAGEHGYPTISILVQRRVDRVPESAADVQGMGATQRIVLAQSIVVTATPGEIDYYVAEAIAELDAHDPLRLALIDAAIAVVGIAIAVMVADRIPFRRDDDPISRTTLVGVLLALVYIPAVLVDHNVVASMRLQSIQRAIAMTGDPASALRALVRAGDERVEQVCPSAAGRIFLSRTPSLGQDASAVGSSSGCTNP